MSDLLTIPKILLPRISINDNQKIPKIIWQTMKSNEVPPFMKSYADSWTELNPDYEYRFHDDSDIINFIKDDFPEYLDGYNKLKYGASKADLWRYLIIYKFGGVYADLDCKCNNALKNWVNPDSLFVTQLGTNKDICQWLIISAPNNPIFLRAAQKTLKNSETNNCKESYIGFEFAENKLELRKYSPKIQVNHSILGLSGPPILQKAAEECLIEGLLSRILPFIQIVCKSSDFISCQMNGNVSHDAGDVEYKKAYKQLKLKHYNNRWERIKRKISKMLISNSILSKR